MIDSSILKAHYYLNSSSFEELEVFLEVRHFWSLNYQCFYFRADAHNRKVSTQSNESASSDHPSAEGSPNLSPRRGKKCHDVLLGRPVLQIRNDSRTI